MSVALLAFDIDGVLNKNNSSKLKLEYANVSCVKRLIMRLLEQGYEVDLVCISSRSHLFSYNELNNLCTKITPAIDTFSITSAPQLRRTSKARMDWLAKYIEDNANGSLGIIYDTVIVLDDMKGTVVNSKSHGFIAPDIKSNVGIQQDDVDWILSQI